MKKYSLIFLSLIIISCASDKQKNKENVTDSLVIDSTINNGLNMPINPLKNGIANKFKGTWINTSLFDSTLSQKRLYPWLDEFYGDLYLEINESDSVLIKGNMDGGKGRIEVIDSNTFVFPGRTDKPRYEYTAEKDLIYSKMGLNKTIVFRRLNSKDRIEIIENQEAFDKFFISKFFTNDYFQGKEKPNIVRISDGFETQTPFEFDAVGLKGKDGKTEYYAWSIKGDTLEIYNTSAKADEDSGFFIYRIGALKDRYIK